MGRLIIDGNKVYELDETCLREKRERMQQRKEQEDKKKKTSNMQMHNKNR
ncbi:MAG: hypothetical protein J6B28_05075 [Eubacterium sp.]|nr:hypothetical protein [Eubacterium sp.]